MDVKKIGVIGAGQMGSGIAQVAAQAGFQVLIFDEQSVALERSLTTIKSSVLKLCEKGKILASEVENLMGRIKMAANINEVAQSDLIIEAIIENFEIKKKLWSNLEAIAPEHTIFCSNTSSISITKLAATTKRPGQFAGMHFMNPVPLMTLVEGIKGLHTSEATFEIVRKTAQKMGKEFVASRDIPGFIVNRILMPMINEAVFALYEGIATAADIDQAMKLGTNQPMGPLVLADFIGLDTCLYIMRILHQELGDSKYRPCPLLVQYVDSGYLGRKTKKGFYNY